VIEKRHDLRENIFAVIHDEIKNEQTSMNFQIV
jgi:hypothetical protein